MSHRAIFAVELVFLLVVTAHASLGAGAIVLDLNPRPQVVRVALVGMGVGVRNHRRLFWGLMVLGGVLLVVSAWKVFTI